MGGCEAAGCRKEPVKLGGGGCDIIGACGVGPPLYIGTLTSSSITGSVPWSYGHRSPRIQKPFSLKQGRSKLTTKKSKCFNIWVKFSLKILGPINCKLKNIINKKVI